MKNGNVVRVPASPPCSSGPSPSAVTHSPLLPRAPANPGGHPGSECTSCRLGGGTTTCKRPGTAELSPSPHKHFRCADTSSLLEKNRQLHRGAEPSTGSRGRCSLTHRSKPYVVRQHTVHDIFIFLFSFALFSCLYIVRVNTHGLSWLRRLPWLFHSC